MTATKPAQGRAASTPKPMGVVSSPLLLPIHAAAALCGTSARTWRAWDVAGKIPSPIRIGRRTFWRFDELQGWVAAGCPDRVTWEALRE